MTRLHRTILILLLLMLPVQGAVAASRWICYAAAQQGTAIASPADHVHRSLEPAHHHEAMHDVGTDLDITHGSDAPTSHDVDGTCHWCAACCLTAAAPSPPFALGRLSPANAGFPPVSVPVPHNVADGPERPPRTV